MISYVFDSILNSVNPEKIAYISIILFVWRHTYVKRAFRWILHVYSVL